MVVRRGFLLLLCAFPCDSCAGYNAGSDDGYDIPGHNTNAPERIGNAKACSIHCGQDSYSPFFVWSTPMAAPSGECQCKSAREGRMNNPECPTCVAGCSKMATVMSKIHEAKSNLENAAGTRKFKERERFWFDPPSGDPGKRNAEELTNYQNNARDTSENIALANHMHDRSTSEEKIAELGKFAMDGWGNSDLMDRTEGSGGLYSAKIPGAIQDGKEWRENVLDALKEVELEIPGRIKYTDEVVENETHDAAVDIEDKLLGVTKDWDEIADNVGTLKNSRASWETLFSEVDRQLKELNVVTYGKIIKHESAAKKKLQTRTAKLMKAFQKYKTKKETALKLDTFRSSEALARFDVETPKTFKKLRRDTRRMGLDTMKRIQEIRANTEGKISQASGREKKLSSELTGGQEILTHLNSDRQDLAAKIKSQEADTTTKMLERLATERSLSKKVNQNVLRELKTTFTLAQKAIAAEGKDAGQVVADNAIAKLHQAEERLVSVADEIRTVGRQQARIVDQGKEGLLKVQNWNTEKKGELDALWEDGSWLANFKSNAESNLEQRQLELAKSNQDQWSYIDPHIQTTSDLILDAKERLEQKLSTAQEKLLDDALGAKTKVLTASNGEPAIANIEQFSGSFDTLVKKFEREVFETAAANMTGIADELGELVDVTIPAHIKDVTHVAIGARDETDLAKQKIDGNVAKLITGINHELGKMSKMMGEKKAATELLKEKTVTTADEESGKITTGVERILDDAQQNFVLAQTADMSDSHRLTTQAKNLMATWNTDVSTAGRTEDALKNSADRLAELSKKGVAESLKLATNTRLGAIQAAKTSLTKQVAGMVSSQEEIVPSRRAQMEAFLQRIQDAKETHAARLTETTEKADATIDAHNSAFKDVEKRQSELKESSGTLMEQHLASIDDVQEELKSSQELAGKAWNMRKKALGSRTAALGAELERQISNSDADVEQEMASAQEHADRQFANLATSGDDAKDSDKLAKLERDNRNAVTKLQRKTAEGKAAVDSLGRINELANAATESLHGAENEVKTEANAQSASSSAAVHGEGEGMAELAEQTSAVVGAVRSAEAAVDKALSSSYDAHVGLAADTGATIGTLKQQAQLSGEAAGSRVNALSATVNAATSSLRKGVTKMSHYLDGSREIIEGSLAHVAESLRTEKTNLREGEIKVAKDSSDRVSALVSGLSSLTASLKPVLDHVQEKLESGKSDARLRDAKFDRVESTKSAHAKYDINGLTGAAAYVDFNWHDFMQWQHGFAAKDVAWKQLVHNELAGFGVHLDTTALDLLKAESGSSHAEDAVKETVEGEVDSKLSALKRETNSKIDAVFADADARIAAIVASSEHLSDEQIAQIAAIRAEAHAKSVELLRQQAEIQRKQAEMQAGLDRYHALISAAKEATQRAVDSGMLAPSVIAVQENLHNVTAQIHHMKSSAYLLSLAQQSNSTALADQNRELATANEKLSAHVAAVEQQLAKLPAKPKHTTL